MIKQRDELKDLKQFGSALAGILLVLGIVNFMKGRSFWYPVFFGLSVIIGSLVLIAPKWIKPVFVIFTEVAHIIGWVNTRIILAFIYFILITPIALIMRIFGKDPLNRKIDKNDISYWTKRANIRSTKESLEKQF